MAQNNKRLIKLENLYKDRSRGELGDKFRDTKPTRSRAHNVKGESERRQDKFYWELKNVNQLLSISSSEELVL
jgi:hypothetical protein